MICQACLGTRGHYFLLHPYILASMSKAFECMCKHLPEIMKANQTKIDAFLDLMKRRPELVKEMVKIEGVFGNWYLDPDDPAIKNRDNLDFWKKRYHCK